MRQSKAIGEAVRSITGGHFNMYVEPFCGAMWSATAMIEAFPDKRFVFNDINPYLMCTWRHGAAGWDPPSTLSLAVYDRLKQLKDPNDPMTGYAGFAWSFGGKFFGGLARDAKGGSRDFGKGSYKSTIKKNKRAT